MHRYSSIPEWSSLGEVEFQGGWNRGVFISGSWNREVPLYTEVSSFQGVGIEEFTVYRGVLISGGWNRGVHCIQRCPHFRVLE